MLVVGGGLAGLTCARGLAAGGLQTMLVDQKRHLAERVHTTGIFVRRTLEEFDLPDDCLGPPVRQVVLYSPARRSIRLRSPHDEFRVGRMGELYRRLRGDAEEAGARVLCGHRFAGVTARAGRVEVVLERTGSGGRRTIEARFVIGADGARSRVAAALGLDRNRRFLVGVEDLVPSPRPGSAPVMHCFVDPALAPGYLAWVVDDGHEVHVGVAGAGRGYAPVAALEAFRAEVELLAPRAGPRIERRGGRIPVGGLLARIACPRGLLVGDASGAVSPLTAGGLDPCLRQSRLAVEVTRAWLAAGDGAVLRAYQCRALRDRFRGRRLLRGAFDRLRAPAAVELALAALRVGPLTGLAERIFFGRGSFPDLDLPSLLAEERPAGLLASAVRALGRRAQEAAHQLDAGA